MEQLKIDRTKLRTVANYAKMIGKDKKTVYNHIEAKKIKSIEIDGVLFVNLA